MIGKTSIKLACVAVLFLAFSAYFDLIRWEIASHNRNLKEYQDSEKARIDTGNSETKFVIYSTYGFPEERNFANYVSETFLVLSLASGVAAIYFRKR